VGATVVSTSVKASNWSKEKPKDYKSKDLDNAIKAYEALSDKGVAMPAQLPTLPKTKISEIQTTIKELEADVTILKKAADDLKKMVTALQAVSAAAAKTSDELEKLGDAKQGSDKKEYVMAAGTARSIGAQASSTLKNIQ
jgi:hypothetical protein